jgi:hypothetical protein
MHESTFRKHARTLQRLQHAIRHDLHCASIRSASDPCRTSNRLVGPVPACRCNISCRLEPRWINF